MELGLYAHPWDLAQVVDEQPGGLARLRELGFDSISHPTAYHAGRWLTPWSRDGLVRFLEDGTVFFRPQDSAAYGVLQPELASSVEAAGDGRSPFDWFCRHAPESGLSTSAWTVFFHNTRLGQMHPDLCVHNAAGDASEYALCPADDDVQRYGLQLAREVGGHEGLNRMEVEALGWMGFGHGGHHNKQAFPVDAHLDFLLSYSFSPAMCGLLRGAGVEVEDVRAKVLTALRRRITQGDALDAVTLPKGEALQLLRSDLGDGQLEALLEVRTQANLAMFARVAGALPDGVRLGTHITFDAMFTGSQLGMEESRIVDQVDDLFLTCYGKGPDKIEAACRDLQPETLAKLHLCILPKAPEFTGDEDVQRLRRLAVERGMAGVRVYHLGLLPWATVERVAGLLR